MSKEYVVVIGLEVHVQLKTNSKLFCGCSTEFGAGQNTHTCPVCLGLPGVLPVANKKAVELAMLAALALKCEVQKYAKFDRKNYFYPDLPKNYQTSQKDNPFSLKGFLEIEVEGKKRIIGVTRAHLEEDAGKLVHIGAGGQIGAAEESLVDLNRTGMPLLEIVSEPDLRSPLEAYEYLLAMKSILRYIGVSDCDMEKGTLRCDANVSLMEKGAAKFGEKVEIKNLNSFKNVQKALEYEVGRQTLALENGEKLIQETRLYNADENVTYNMRTKEEAHDYRYFPEPDLVPFTITDAMIAELSKKLVELPSARKSRFVSEYGLPAYDAGVLTASKETADYFEACVKLYNKPKAISNLVMVDLGALLKEAKLEISASPVKPENIVKLVKLVEDAVISSKISKTVIDEMFKTGKDPETIVKEKGLVQITDEGAIAEAVDKVLAANPKATADFHAGNERALGSLVGQVMKATGGKANPQTVNKLLKQRLCK
ncbi:MAG: Asp-tRNA(Asn)/Glu-tRNA(Gln) amidotransferase subunit GatB [Candidatus Firestonebacteria bacterium]